MVTSIYWNPAALGMLSGTHVFVDGTLRITHGTVTRRSINPATGRPSVGGAAVSFDAQDFVNLTPDCFFGFSTDLGSDSVVLGVALYTPFAEMERFGGKTIPGADAPLRYHRVKVDWFNLFVSPVVAVKFHKRFLVGVGLSYVRSIMNMSFYRDRTLRETYQPTATEYTVEDPLRSEKVVFEAAENSVTFNLGVVVRLPAKITLGAAYRSKALGLERSDIEASGKVRVTRFDEDVGKWTEVAGRAKVYYALPDSFVFGAGWKVQPQWQLNLSLEWLHYAVHKDIHFKFSGNAFRAAAMGNWDVNFRHYRGFNDVWRVNAGAAYKPIKTLRVGGGVRYESTAVKKKWVNPAAMDGHKADFLFTAEWYPHRSVSIHLGYSVILTAPLDVKHSGFDPAKTTSCVTNQVDIVWNDDCNAVNAGKGLPTAAGKYWFVTHKVGLGVAYHYW
jgi:long-subunit fatty acid transport protein